MRSPNRIIVQIEKRFNDETKSGFYIDTTYKPEHYSMINGKVIAVAENLPKDFRTPGFFNTPEVGDTLYFHYLVVIDPDCHLFDNYYIVDYFQAFATVKPDGKIVPVGEHILVTPITEEVKHDFLVIPEMLKKQVLNKGIVFSSNDPTIPAGSAVLFEEQGKFENEIEGKSLFVMYNSNILGILHEKE